MYRENSKPQLNFYDMFMYYREHPDELGDKEYKRELEERLAKENKSGHTFMDFRAVGKTMED